MQPCPYCAEMIDSAVTSCPYCASDLDGPTPQPRPVGRGRSGPPCPECGNAGSRPGPWPWYLGTVGALIVRAVICSQCGHHFDAKKPQADLAKRKLWLAIIINGIGGAGIVAVIGCLTAFAMSL